MTPERWRFVEEVFGRALELDTVEREQYVAGACADDHALLREVETLLDSVAGATERLQRTVAGAATAVSSLVGERLGPYLLVRAIGVGGMGTVYLAKRDDDEYSGRVAIKVLRNGLTSGDLAARLRDERRVLAALSHPGIVRLFDGGRTPDGSPYLVMEYVDGTPLAVHARGRDRRALLELVISIADALQYAHQQLVVHRDIKPSNILVDGLGTPKLIDFGIAKLLGPTDDRETETGTGGAPFTLQYASPEQVRGGPISVATDVYSLGAVLYELLVGQPPQRAGASPLETLENICERDPVRPGSLQRDLAGDLDSIVLKALQKAPEKRYASCAQFADDLRRYLDGSPVAARDATLAYRTRKFVARHRGKLAIATLVASALAIVLAASVIQARRADRQAARAERDSRALLVARGREELARGAPERALAYLATAMREGEDTPPLRFLVAEARRLIDCMIATVEVPAGVSSFGWSPRGDVVAIAGSDGRVRICDRNGTVRRELAVGTIPVFASTFSPDGQTLVVATDAGQVVALDVQTGARRFTVDAHRDTRPELAISGLLFSSDGTRLTSAGFDGRIVRWDARTGERLATIEVQSPLSSLATSRDGRLIASGSYDGSIRVFDAEHGTLLGNLAGHTDRVLQLAFSPDATRLYSTSEDGNVRIWDVPGRTTIATLPGHTFDLDVAGDRLATGAPDSFVRLWDASDGRLLGKFFGHVGEVRSVQLRADGGGLVSTGADGVFRTWDVHDETTSSVIEAVPSGGNAAHATSGAAGAAFSPDGTLLLAASATAVSWWRLDHGPLAVDITAPDDLLSAVFSPDETQVATTGVGVLAVWSARDGRLVWTVPVTGHRIYDVDWSPDGTTLVVAGEPDVARLFTASGAPRVALVGHTGTVYRASFSPDGNRIATAGSDHTAIIWDATTGALLSRIPHPDRVMAAAWSRDGARLATASYDHHLRVWDARTGALLVDLDGRTEQFLDVTFSPDGRKLASGSHGGAVQIWDLATRRAHLLEGHTQAVSAVVWSPDGMLLASSSVDGSSRIWDATTGMMLGTRSHAGEVMSVRWNHDGTRTLTASVDGHARIWQSGRDQHTAAETVTWAATHAHFRIVDGRLERTALPR